MIEKVTIVTTYQIIRQKTKSQENTLYSSKIKKEEPNLFFSVQRKNLK